jgi:hypothetical protein
MACAAGIPVVLTLLIGAAEGAIPATVMTGVISSLQRHFLSGCVFLLDTADHSDLSTSLLCQGAVRCLTRTVAAATARRRWQNCACALGMFCVASSWNGRKPWQSPSAAVRDITNSITVTVDVKWAQFCLLIPAIITYSTDCSIDG